MNIKVAIVIPTYNRVKITKKCVESLLSGTYENIKIIICDSDSSDGTNLLFQDEPRVSILNVSSDLWWSGSVNRGISLALKQQFECIVIMNDDINFDSQLIRKLVDNFIACSTIIISPAQHTKNGIFLGTNYSKIIKKKTHIWKNTFDLKKIEVQTSNGCCLLIPASIFKNAGLFDEINCPHLAGDFEFQIRAGRLGYKTYAFPDIEIYQQPPTNYTNKAYIFNAFKFKGSPILFSQYISLGKQLFGGFFSFIFLGIIYHISYIYSVIKILLKIFFR